MLGLLATERVFLAHIAQISVPTTPRSWYLPTGLVGHRWRICAKEDICFYKLPVRDGVGT